MPTDASSPGSEELRALVRSAQDGDADALERLVQLHLPALHGYLRLNVNQRVRLRESCSDVAQSVCREALTHLDRFEFRGRDSFRHWLFTTALNKIRQKNRYHGAEKRDPAKEVRAVESDASRTELVAAYASLPTPSAAMAATDRIDRIESAMDALPEHYRQVITLCRLLGLPQREVAQRMERSEASVRNLLNRALVQLAALLDDGDSGP